MSIPVFNLFSVNGSDGFRLNGVSQGDLSGNSVSNAGDVNGDGFDDFIIGAFGAPNGNFYGSSYVVFGKATKFDAQFELSSLDGSNGFRLDGAYGEQAGIVSNAGDVNGDGFDDVMIGAGNADPNGYYSGSSFVVFGKASGFDAHTELSSLDGSNGFRLDGAEAYDSLGSSVSSAGDVNGDGFDDVILNAPGIDPSLGQGSSFVVFGKSSGFAATLDISSIDGSNGFYFTGEEVINSVSSAGDMNGDGFDDVIIGAALADNAGYMSGSSYVVFGKANGLGAAVDLSQLDGSNGFRLDGENAGDLSGVPVSSAGDVNGDGFDDMIVGASFADSNGGDSGSSYVVFGKALGFDAVTDLSNLDGSNGFRMDGVANDRSGFAVSGAGDVNGDGFDDVIVGAPYAEPNGFKSGSSYVVLGRSSFDAELDFSNLKDGHSVRLDGNERDRSGISVSGAGDVNGDGFDDLIVGAEDADSNGSVSGASYVLFGSSDFGGGDGGGGELPEITGTADDDTLKGSEAAEHFIAGAGNDNLLGRGGADVFDAGAGDDAIRIGDLTFASIDGGEGNDALHLAGSGMNLDLSALGDQIHNIETICLYGRGDNTLTLTAGSLLNLSSSTNTLKVHGNSGDHIVVQDSGWVDGGSQGFYHTYTHDDAVLLVGANLAIDFV